MCMSDFTLSDALTKRIVALAKAESMSVEELLTVMVERYTVASKLKTAKNPLALEQEPDDSPEYPVLSAYPTGSLAPITADNIDQMTVLGALKFPDDRICGIQFSPDGKYLVIRLEQRLVLWDVQRGQEYAIFEHNAWI